ncbi:hypothetical protein PanWU01x14_219820 [Parasponia andersonii]|uniref:Uncharacterized protein n=1 Tax=Parasponia andersonii TaxID=3476 RepID=A0A2P5BQ81_PARAD|nr:hypothetical protein PanWU01x14_219820 [Parasponia andersonii]
MSLLLVFVMIPTIGAAHDHDKPSPPPPPVPSKSPPAAHPPPSRGVPPPHTPTPLSSSSSSSPSPPIRSPHAKAAALIRRTECPKLLKKEMVARVLKRLSAPKSIKSILNKSAKFGLCVAGKFCSCMMLRFQPLIYGCFAVVGARCMKRVISNRVYSCTLVCAKSMKNANQRVDEVAVGGFCYSKCLKTA